MQAFTRKIALAAALLAAGSSIGSAQAQVPAAPIAKAGGSHAAATACQDMAKADFTRLADFPTAILSASLVPAKDGVAEHCAITGTIQPQIQFEIRLPMQGWNGRYFQVGCGGFCGVINIQNCADAQAANFVVAAHNMGHVGMVTKDPVWGADQDLRTDFAGRSTHAMAVVGKAIATRFYGAQPEYAYFRGCSTGGREGLTLAQRYPDDFDGIIAGDPAFAGRLGAIANNWDAHHLLRADGSEVFTRPKLKVLADAVMAACDEKDGLKDGIITDPRACHFDPTTLACPEGQEGDACLTPEQVKTAIALYDGPRNSRGRALMPGATPLGSELSWSGAGRRALAEGYLRYLAFAENPPADYDYRSFDFNKDIAAVEAQAALYDPVAPYQAPDLSGFAATGGKLIVYHGWADAGVSPYALLDYHAHVVARAGGPEKAQDWMRVFMVPGMFHCRGGDAPNSFDMLPAMVEWVEQNRAPDSILATQREGDRIVRTRPLYPYPAVATYKGHGDVNDAANWKPVSPKHYPDDRIDWIWAPK
ncbi:tannase/feruloyl esterase family alpha/beta hydrolase [Niveispirillum irakense]|uniref:tannase/feruloyl esterase family alpha/beta hydrolase n=1 Tax=Niveispirillum irakense TaxID=34011 RepID=UPI0003FA4FD5|nr:tannase/feruloyl esterase family alpha/beta hydrolase [Niveispirillum irakense]